MMEPDSTTSLARDGELLAAFASGREQEAFAELVRRHGGMVLSVCRAILGNGPDAEDAAQAAFVALMAKSGSLAKHPTLAGWLHRAAWFAATHARRARSVRIRLEQEAARMKDAAQPIAAEPVPPESLHLVLDELPEKYRLAMVLRYLEGRSQQETAALLGCSDGAVAMRLQRGREMLRARLLKRGIGVSSGAVLAALATPASGAPSPDFVAMTIKAAADFAAGAGPAAVTAISRGVLHMYLIAKVKIAATVAVLVLLVGAASVIAYLALATDGPKLAVQTPAAPTPGQPLTREQLIKRAERRPAAPTRGPARPASSSPASPMARSAK